MAVDSEIPANPGAVILRGDIRPCANNGGHRFPVEIDSDSVMPQSPEDRPVFYAGGGDPRIKRSGRRAQNRLSGLAPIVGPDCRVLPACKR